MAYYTRLRITDPELKRCIRFLHGLVHASYWNPSELRAIRDKYCLDQCQKVANLEIPSQPPDLPADLPAAPGPTSQQL